MSSTDGMNRDYDDHSKYQRDIAQTGAKLVKNCIDALELPEPPHPIVLMDLGVATGRNSLEIMSQAVGAVRERDHHASVVCVYNDVMSNDWTQLFGNVARVRYPDVPGSAVLPMASATSFFDPTVPPGLAHLQMSFSAAHWLRKQPTVAVPQGFFFCEATGDIRSCLADQAAADWRSFARSRASDLAQGGFLVVQCVGTQTGETELVTARELLAAITATARAMSDDGLLDRKVVDSYVFPVYARTVAEARAPFEEPESGFELLEVSTAPVPNPYLDQWRKDGDLAAYAHSYADFVRGFADSALRRGLLTPAAGDRNVDKLSDEYFARLEARFIAEPEASAFRDWTLTVVARRR